jgi:hypothetical protein
MCNQHFASTERAELPHNPIDAALAFVFSQIEVSGVSLISESCIGALALLRPLRTSALAPIALVIATLAGCAGMPKPQIGPVQFTTASGASLATPASLPVNAQVYVVADVTNDDQLLGVSWTVTCGSAAAPGGISIDNACGAFNPAHTESGPVPLYLTTGIITTYNAPAAIPNGSNVTITAHATALPSVTSSVTLTVTSAGTH